MDRGRFLQEGFGLVQVRGVRGTFFQVADVPVELGVAGESVLGPLPGQECRGRADVVGVGHLGSPPALEIGKEIRSVRSDRGA